MGRQLLPNLLKPSDLAWNREARRTPGYSLFDWLHGQVYGRFPYLYIGIGTGHYPLARVIGPLFGFASRLVPRRGDGGDQRSRFADEYHGKVMTLESATQLVTVEQDVTLRDLEQVIPYAAARDIVLRNPDHIIALDCPCRTAREHPCLPIDVCLIVGEPFASFVAEHHPERTRWITQAEAVDILRAEHERGHVSHAFFKEAMLGRFYAICNCCSCCCGAMQAQRNGTPMLCSSGYVSRSDESLCAGCGTCVDVCQFHAVSLEDGHCVIDYDACMGCGVCVSHCPNDALVLFADPAKGVPLEIRSLLAGAARPAPSAN